MEAGVACNDIYRVRLSKNLKKIYEILKTPGGEKIVFIDFRYDKEAILGIFEGFKDRLSEGLDLIVSLVDEANILESFIG